MQKKVNVDANNGGNDSLVLHSARRCHLLRGRPFIALRIPILASTTAQVLWQCARGVFFFLMRGRPNAARCDDPPYGHLPATGHPEQNLPLPSLWPKKKFLPL
jgi:hypothetical protein